MKKLSIPFLICGIMILGTLLAACGSPPSLTSEVPTLVPAAGALPLQVGQIRQWADGAVASSEFADPEWAAIQAIGAPDTPRCGDYQTAWATAGSDISATLVLTYSRSLHVTGINIVETFNPNQITQVELIGIFDRAVTVYENSPFQVDQPCPYTLSIPVEKTEQPYNTVRITVDQSILGLGWNQIDAVELIGDLE